MSVVAIERLLVTALFSSLFFSPGLDCKELHQVSVQGFTVGMQEDEALKQAKLSGWKELGDSKPVHRFFAAWVPPEHSLGESLKLGVDKRHRICSIDITMYSLALSIDAHKIFGPNARAELIRLAGHPDRVEKIETAGTKIQYSKLGLQIWIWATPATTQIYRIRLKEIIERPGHVGWWTPRRRSACSG